MWLRLMLIAWFTNGLAQFGLKDLRELPRREDLLLEPPQPAAQPIASEDTSSESGPS